MMDSTAAPTSYYVLYTPNKYIAIQIYFKYYDIVIKNPLRKNLFLKDSNTSLSLIKNLEEGIQGDKISFWDFKKEKKDLSYQKLFKSIYLTPKDFIAAVEKRLKETSG